MICASSHKTHKLLKVLPRRIDKTTAWSEDYTTVQLLEPAQHSGAFTNKFYFGENDWRRRKIKIPEKIFRRYSCATLEKIRTFAYSM